MLKNEISTIMAIKDAEDNIIYILKKKAELIDELTKNDLLPHFKDCAPIEATKDYRMLTSMDFETFTIEGRT